MAIAVVARSLASSSFSSSACSHLTLFLSKRFFSSSSHPAVFGPSHFAGLGGLRPSSSALSRPTVGLVAPDAFGVSSTRCMASDSAYSPLNSGSGGTNPFITISVMLADIDQACCANPFSGGGASSDPVAALHLFLSMLRGPTQATLSSLLKSLSLLSSPAFLRRPPASSTPSSLSSPFPVYLSLAAPSWCVET